MLMKHHGGLDGKITPLRRKLTMGLGAPQNLAAGSGRNRALRGMQAELEASLTVVLRTTGM